MTKRNSEQHRIEDETKYLPGFEHFGPGHGAGVAGVPARTSLARPPLSDRRRHAAMAAAEESIWSDRRLLGIPHVRWKLVKLATDASLGKEVPLDLVLTRINSPPNTEVITSAFQSATCAGIQATSRYDKAPENAH